MKVTNSNAEVSLHTKDWLQGARVHLHVVHLLQSLAYSSQGASHAAKRWKIQETALAGPGSMVGGPLHLLLSLLFLCRPRLLSCLCFLKPLLGAGNDVISLLLLLSHLAVLQLLHHLDCLLPLLSLHFVSHLEAGGFGGPLLLQLCLLLLAQPCSSGAMGGPCAQRGITLWHGGWQRSCKAQRWQVLVKRHAIVPAGKAPSSTRNVPSHAPRLLGWQASYKQDT